MNKHYNIIAWVLVVALVVVCINLISINARNQNAIENIQEQKDIQRKESQKKIDSLNTLIIEKEDEFNKKIRIFERSKDSLNELYEKSNWELSKIKTDISKYLISSDSVRFSKFKQLITEMD